MEIMVLQTTPSFGQVKVTVDGKTFETFGHTLHQNRGELIGRGIDADLIDLICLCRACDPKLRPRPADLAIRVRERVLNRGANGVVEETNDHIRWLVSYLVLDADASPSKKRRRTASDEGLRVNESRKRLRIEHDDF